MAISRSASYALSACAVGLMVAGCGRSQLLPGTPEALPLANRVVIADRGSGVVQPAFSCSKAPCAFANVQASGGPKLVNETPIVVNPRNNQQLLTAGNDANCDNWALSPWGTGMYASSNGGKTWVHSCLPLVKYAVGTGYDPGVAYDLHGTAFASGMQFFNWPAWNSQEDVISSSANHGRTFGAPVVAVAPYYKPHGTVDKPWLAIDTSASSPYRNDLYVSVGQFSVTQYSGAKTQITVSHSTDGGRTWKMVKVGPTTKWPASVDAANIVTGKDGTLYLVDWACTFNASTTCAGTKGTISYFKSTDGGKTWSSGVVVDRPMFEPNGCSCSPYGSLPNTNEPIADIPTIAVDNSSGPRAGTLYVVDFSWVRNNHMQVQLLSSTDGGTTWSKPHRVASASDTHDQFFPWVSVSATGIIGVTWLDRRNDPSNLSYEEFGAYSSDGVHFPNYQIASEPSNPNNDGEGGAFVGDYTGNAWAGRKLYAAWPDTRNGVDAQDMVGGLQMP